jgi:hypothetical protein
MKDIVTANCSIQGIAVKIMKDLVWFLGSKIV